VCVGLTYVNIMTFKALWLLGALGLVVSAIALHASHLEAATFVGHLSHGLAWVHNGIIMDD
jgi:hypothetical protein